MRNETNEEAKPEWLMPGGRVNELEFCRQFVLNHPLVYLEGAFFSINGRVSSEDVLRRMIYRELCQYICCSLAPKVESILSTLRLECVCTRLEDNPEDFVVYTRNGNYSLIYGFSPMRTLTRYRLPVDYNPDAPKPERWLRFLHELLREEDILTLQEYMGYCLIPSTAAQKMLIITGKGGEGKSRIGVVMKALLGINMNLGSIAKVELSPFARADLEHLLVMVDDDLKMEALTQTNYIKSIITAEIPMDLERKGIQSYQGKLNVRFLAFGNGSLQALHDRSHGFFRRQIILTAKERDPNRTDDPYLAQQLIQETEGILLWCIEGLQRLVLQNYQFTISSYAKENLENAMARGDNVIEFMKSQGYIRLDPDGCATSRSLYSAYRDWCDDNTLNPLSANSFWGHLMQNAQSYRITPSKNIPAGTSRRVRGFRGIRVCPR